MANFYKTLNRQNDIVSTRTLLHEAIPLTGTIVSGTYSDNNIKTYSHGMFESVYDYPYLSSSANHIFDITAGYHSTSFLSSSTNTQNAKKINIYNQMSQILMGYDQTGSILQFDEDGDLLAGGTKIKEAIFINFSRLLAKDEIKKGSFQLDLGVTPTFSTNGACFSDRIRIKDTSGSAGYLVNSPAGEYGVLHATNNSLTPLANALGSTVHPVNACGLVFYQAGIAVLSGSVFDGLLTTPVSMSNPSLIQAVPTEHLNDLLTGSTITTIADNVRNRIHNLQFNNTVELNSTIYFCRVNHNDFNYSSNPTYLTGSKLRVKTKSTDLPVSYITSVGLYNNNNELMAIAKLSEPLKKTPDTEFTIRVRLDY